MSSNISTKLYGFNAHYESWIEFIENKALKITDIINISIKYNSKSEIIKNEYEGGFSSWECENDLVDYFTNFCSNLVYKDGILSILDLGCGNARVSEYIVRERFRIGRKTKLYLQDLNREVLFDVNKRLLNLESLAEIHYISCNWDEIEAWISKDDKSSIVYLSNLAIDCVISSETLYRCENFGVLTKFFLKLNASNSSMLIFLSQKRYYFGLGGGTVPYIKYLKSTFQGISVEFVRKTEDGENNIRDIISVSFNSV